MYKVVALHGGTLRSFYSGAKESIEYRIGQWAKPQKDCGGLLVFDTLENTTRFARGAGEIYECEVADPTPIPNYCGDASMNKHWPQGTRAFNRVRLIKKHEEPA